MILSHSSFPNNTHSNPHAMFPSRLLPSPPSPQQHFLQKRVFITEEVNIGVFQWLYFFLFVIPPSPLYSLLHLFFPRPFLSSLTSPVSPPYTPLPLSTLPFLPLTLPPLSHSLPKLYPHIRSQPILSPPSRPSTPNPPLIQD